MARGAEPRGTHPAGGELASSCRIPFVLCCMAAGREDEVTSEEEGGGVWKQWLCFWDGHLASLRKLVSQLCNGDCWRRFAFVFHWEHSCQAIILHPIALQTCLFKSDFLPHN